MVKLIAPPAAHLERYGRGKSVIRDRLQGNLFRREEN